MNQPLLPLELQIVACTTLLVISTWVIYLVRFHHLSLRDSFLWLVSTGIVLVFALFPWLLQTLAHAISSALRRADLAQLQLPTLHDILSRAHEGVDALTHLHLPKIPTREEFLAEAKAMFARTRSLNEIVDYAYEHFLESVRAQLATAR